MKKGFTLAEVLITLGIIGVVAAMTLPTLIQNYKNQVVETRLKKFYSVMNQAVMLSESENGDKKDWFEDLSGMKIDEDGNPIEGTSLALNWYNKYLAKYIKTTKITIDSQGKPTFYLADGSAFAPSYATTRDWYFYPGDVQKCIKRHPPTASAVCSGQLGICAFAFNFRPIKDASPLWKFAYNKGFEPWVYSWDGTKEGLYTNPDYGCSKTSAASPSLCATLIMQNNWKIPKDYPFKVDY